MCHPTTTEFQAVGHEDNPCDALATRMSEHTGLKVKLKLPLFRKSDQGAPEANKANRPQKRKRPEDSAGPHHPAQNSSIAKPPIHRPPGFAGPPQLRQSFPSDASAGYSSRPPSSHRQDALTPILSNSSALSYLTQPLQGICIHAS